MVREGAGEKTKIRKSVQRIRIVSKPQETRRI